MVLLETLQRCLKNKDVTQSAKFQYLKDYIEQHYSIVDNQNKKIVIFSFFRGTLDKLEILMQSLRIGYQRIDGFLISWSLCLFDI